MMKSEMVASVLIVMLSFAWALLLFTHQAPVDVRTSGSTTTVFSKARQRPCPADAARVTGNMDDDQNPQKRSQHPDYM